MKIIKGRLPSARGAHMTLHRLAKEGYIEGREIKNGNHAYWTYRRPVLTNGTPAAPPTGDERKPDKPAEPPPSFDTIMEAALGEAPADATGDA